MRKSRLVLAVLAALLLPALAFAAEINMRIAVSLSSAAYPTATASTVAMPMTNGYSTP